MKLERAHTYKFEAEDFDGEIDDWAGDSHRISVTLRSTPGVKQRGEASLQLYCTADEGEIDRLASAAKMALRERLKVQD